MINPQEVYAKQIKAGEDWSDLNAAACLLEETRKPLRSTIALERIQKGDSAAASEMYAEADERYKKHVTDMVEARRLADRARVKWESIKTYNSLLQTKEATARAEMQLR